MPETSAPLLSPPAPSPAAPVRPASKPAAPTPKSKGAKPAAKRAKRTAKKAARQPSRPNLAALAGRLEASWEAALAAHRQRVRGEFGALRKALRTPKAGRDAKRLATILSAKVKAKGRRKDLRRAEAAVAKALERLRA